MMKTNNTKVLCAYDTVLAYKYLGRIQIAFHSLSLINRNKLKAKGEENKIFTINVSVDKWQVLVASSLGIQFCAVVWHFEGRSPSLIQKKMDRLFTEINILTVQKIFWLRYRKFNPVGGYLISS